MPVKYLNIWYTKEMGDGIALIYEYDYKMYKHFGVASKNSLNKMGGDEFQIRSNGITNGDVLKHI